MLLVRLKVLLNVLLLSLLMFENIVCYDGFVVVVVDVVEVVDDDLVRMLEYKITDVGLHVAMGMKCLTRNIHSFEVSMLFLHLLW